MRILLSFFLACMIPCVALAQNVVRCNVRGTVYESQELKVMEGGSRQAL